MMLLMPLAAFGGFVFAMKMSLIVQFIAFVGIIWFMCSEWMKSQEIGGLIYAALVAWFIGGMFIGDFAYMLQAGVKVDIASGLKWLVTP